MPELACGILVSIGIYLVLESNIIRRVFGIVVLSTAINIILLISGRLSQTLPAFVNHTSSDKLANPLPQALTLTAIVIGFGLLAFLCVLIKSILIDCDRKKS